MKGSYDKILIIDDYIDYLMGYVNLFLFKFLRLVVNSGNGVVGYVIDVLEKCFIVLDIFIILIKIYNELDGIFFYGIFNLLLFECW